MRKSETKVGITQNNFTTNQYYRPHPFPFFSFTKGRREGGRKEGKQVGEEGGLVLFR